MSVRDNIDLVESMTQLCRARFPLIISLLMSRMPNCPGSVRGLVDECLLTLRQLCALVLNICEDGQTGVEGIFREIIVSIIILHQINFNRNVNFFRLDTPWEFLQTFTNGRSQLV